MSTLVIAEAGVNHNGDPELALRLVDAAADARADVVKFQTFDADRLATRTAPKADYQDRAAGVRESQHAMLKRLELTRDTHVRLIERCRARGIGFLSTGFDIDSVAMLAGLGLDRFKIPSGEITNLPYLRHVGSYGRPVILSTGMATMEEIAASLEALESAGTPRRRVTLLHCTSAYPARMADVNLLAIATLREAFGTDVGYSDHTEGIEVAVAAVALGASVIEKHFTLDRTMDGPDHRASIEPEDLAAMIAAIRNIEAALGDGRKRPMPGEEGTRAVARKSLVAAVPIRAGETFSERNVVAKRAGAGLSPMRWDDVVGRVAERDYAQDEGIEL